MTRVLLADDHGIVLDGLVALLSSQPELQVVGTCVDGGEVVEFVARDQPDILIMDLKMPRLCGLRTIAELSGRGILPPTILIAAQANAEEVQEAMRAGAWGVIMKDQAPSQILKSVYAVLDGEEWEPELNGGHPGLGLNEETLGPLTERELEVARRAARGSSNKAIARELGIAAGTVKVHLHRTYQKLDLGNRVQLALLMREAGLA